MQGVGLMTRSRRRRAPPPAVLYSNPTPERVRHAGDKGFVVSGNARSPVRVMTMCDNPLARAEARGVITNRQYQAGRKFHHHWYHGGLADALQSVDLNRVFASDVTAFSGMAKTEGQVFHRREYRKAVWAVGPGGLQVLDWVVCREQPLEALGRRLGWNSKPQATAAATERLKLALDLLIDLWG